jgi:hypothetical protein
MRIKSRKIIIFLSLLIISVSLSFSGVFAENPITENEESQLLQISQTPFDTRDVYINRLIDWQCFYQTGSMATFVTDPSDHNSGTVYGSFYKKSDYTQLVFDFYNENKSMISMSQMLTEQLALRFWVTILQILQKQPSPNM